MAKRVPGLDPEVGKCSRPHSQPLASRKKRFSTPKNCIPRQIFGSQQNIVIPTETINIPKNVFVFFHDWTNRNTLLEFSGHFVKSDGEGGEEVSRVPTVKNRLSNKEKRPRRVGEGRERNVGRSSGGRSTMLAVGWRCRLGGWLVVVGFFSMEKSKKKTAHKSNYSASFSLSLLLRERGSFISVECLKKEP